MYYPYLYGRQAELNAATGMAQKKDNQQVFPLFEPVSDIEGNDKLERALRKMQTTMTSTYLVVNPHQGDFRQESNRNTWSEKIGDILSGLTEVRPVFNETPTTTLAEIQGFLRDNKGKDAGVILSSSRIRPADLQDYIEDEKVVLFIRAGADVAGYSRTLDPSSIVEIRDNFNSQERNADYSGEEWLSNNHLTYREAGHRGFSDYTMLPGKYEPGGGPIGAAAIHLTYKNSDDTFWVQHFVSDEIDRNVGNTSSKLLEALEYLQKQVNLTPSRFEASPALDNYLKQLLTGQPTNLPKSKELQVSHHLFTVAKHLEG